MLAEIVMGVVFLAGGSVPCVAPPHPPTAERWTWRNFQSHLYWHEVCQGSEAREWVYYWSADDNGPTDFAHQGFCDGFTPLERSEAFSEYACGEYEPRNQRRYFPILGGREVFAVSCVTGIPNRAWMVCVP